MKNIILLNDSDKDIRDYRIEEAVMDQNEEPMIDPLTNRPKWSGKTLEWNLGASETAEFPEYVAKVLLNRFSFVRITNDQPEIEEVKEKVIPVVEPKGEFTCKHCNKVFATQKALGLHTGLKHWDEIKDK